MEHINVVSYLLGAVVFSVGFLSARLHASADIQLQEANDASWRIREILAKGDRLAPTELVGLLSIVRGRSDSIAQLMRWLNGALLVGALLVAADFYRLLAAGVDHSPSSAFLISILGGFAVAVGVIGEADARHLRRTTDSQLRGTTLGHIERIDSALGTDQLEIVVSELDALTRVFPDWGLLFELRALVALRLEEFGEALEMVLDYLAGPADDIYLSSVVGCAAAMRQGDVDTALRVLDMVDARGGLSGDDVTLRRSLELRAGNLDLVLDGDAPETLGSSARSQRVAQEQRATNQVPLVNIGADDLGFLGARSALDVRPTQVTELKGIISAFQSWNARSDDGFGPDDLVGTPFGLVLELIREGHLSDDLADRFEGCAAAAKDGASVEAMGLFMLVGGRPRSAVEILERAVSRNPKSARVHWAHAVSCWSWGWEDKATESLGRALALEPEDVVLSATAQRFADFGSGETRALDSDVLNKTRWSNVRALQFALLGSKVQRSESAANSPRAQFADDAIRMAHEAANQVQMGHR